MEYEVMEYEVMEYETLKCTVDGFNCILYN